MFIHWGLCHERPANDRLHLLQKRQRPPRLLRRETRQPCRRNEQLGAALRGVRTALTLPRFLLDCFTLFIQACFVDKRGTRTEEMSSSELLCAACATLTTAPVSA